MSGDGAADLVVGAPTVGDLGGMVYALPGAWSGVDPKGGAFAMRTGSAESLAGTDLTLVDLDADGRLDLVAGAPNAASGEVLVWMGPVTGVGDAGAATRAWTGAARGDGVGWAVLGVPDLDEDGYDDLLVGAPSWGGGEGPGVVIRVSGGER